MNYFELAASETPLHKIGTDVIGRCWIWIWTWMALWNSICTFILGRGRHSCTTGCSHIFILNSCSSCAACYSLASKLFCALALQKHTADTWQVHLGWGHIFIQTLGKRRGCSEDEQRCFSNAGFAAGAVPRLTGSPGRKVVQGLALRGPKNHKEPAGLGSHCSKNLKEMGHIFAVVRGS